MRVHGNSMSSIFVKITLIFTFASLFPLSVLMQWTDYQSDFQKPKEIYNRCMLFPSPLDYRGVTELCIVPLTTCSSSIRLTARSHLHQANIDCHKPLIRTVWRCNVSHSQPAAVPGIFKEMIRLQSSNKVLHSWAECSGGKCDPQVSNQLMKLADPLNSNQVYSAQCWEITKKLLLPAAVLDPEGVITGQGDSRWAAHGLTRTALLQLGVKCVQLN